MCIVCIVFFFFKQKTAYEMRISDWSSDVCSSDLVTAWAAVMEFLQMLEQGHIKIDDILLLFIYLELGAMVGIYFKTNHMPVRFLIYVAITALSRLLISDVSTQHSPDMGVVYVSGAILLRAFAFLVVRFASSRFPAVQSDLGRPRTSLSRDQVTQQTT